MRMKSSVLVSDGKGIIITSNIYEDVTMCTGTLLRILYEFSHLSSFYSSNNSLK